MKTHKKFWTISAFLAVGIVLSLAVLAGSLHYTRGDKNTINLAAVSKENAEDIVKAQDVAANEENALAHLTPSVVTPTDIAYSGAAASAAAANPGMKVEDENGVVWTYSATPVEIFHKEYGGDYPITVLTSNDDKLIAPGTENDYTFSLKNTGDVPLSYKMWMESYIDPEGLKIPIEVKVKGASGKWIKGTDEKWEEFLSLNDVSDANVLNVNSYANYELDWQWPYETGEAVGENANGTVKAGDEYDTWLGNKAVEEDLSVKVIIHVMACYDASEPSPTGDNNMLYISITAAVLFMIAAAVLIVFMVKNRKKKKEENE